MAWSATLFNTNALYQGVNQVAHGFSLGDVLRFDGTDFVLAQADTEPNAEVVGIVSSIPDANSFYITQVGYIFNLTTTPVSPGGAYVPGTIYYLSPASAGNLTATKPVTTGQVEVPCFIAYTATSGFFFGNVGDLIPDTSMFANVNLSNLSATAVNTDIIPALDGVPDLGTSLIKWGTLYADVIGDDTLTNTQAPGTADDTIATTRYVDDAVAAGSGANINLSNLASTAVNTDIIPDIDGVPDLGSSSKKWGTLYVDTIDDGALTATQPPNTNDATLATTQYVDTAVNARALAVTAGNYFIAQLPGAYDPYNQVEASTVGISGQFTTKVHWYPFYVYQTDTFDRLAINVGTAEAVSEVTMGIYASDPTSKAPVGSSLATTTCVGTGTGPQEGTVNVQLNPGLYYFAVQTSSSVTLSLKGSFSLSVTASLGGLGMGSAALNTFANSYLAYNQNHVYSSGVLPTVSGAVLTTVNGFLCAAYLRAS